MQSDIGSCRWAIPEGYIPAWSNGPKPELESHGTACILNASEKDARVHITIFYADRDPVAGYEIIVPAKRARHVRFSELSQPEEIPRGTDFASVIESDVPIVVQHTRLDSRQPDTALLSTMAFPS